MYHLHSSIFKKFYLLNFVTFQRSIHSRKLLTKLHSTNYMNIIHFCEKEKKQLTFPNSTPTFPFSLSIVYFKEILVILVKCCWRTSVCNSTWNILTCLLWAQLRNNHSDPFCTLACVWDDCCCWGLSAHGFYPPFRSCSLAQNPSESALMASLDYCDSPTLI